MILDERVFVFHHQQCSSLCTAAAGVLGTAGKSGPVQLPRVGKDWRALAGQVEGYWWSRKDLGGRTGQLKGYWMSRKERQQEQCSLCRTGGRPRWKCVCQAVLPFRPTKMEPQPKGLPERL